MPAPVQPIIIIKKKVHGHGGHHGGAWKVAYADFVTAMMALFIVLWLMNSAPKIKQSVSGYFKDPMGFKSQRGTGVSGVGQGLTIRREDLSKLKDKLEEAVRKAPEFDKLKNNVEMTVTGEGLRIELIESTEKGTFFGNGDARPTPLGREMLSKLAAELATLNNPVLVEGHTDSKKYGSDVYTNWELSSDRANCARRILRDGGLASGRIRQVRGFADQQLRLPNTPDDPRNRRVSVIVGYARADNDSGAEEAENGQGEKAAAGKDGAKAAVRKAGEAKASEKPGSKEAGAKPAAGAEGKKAA